MIGQEVYETIFSYTNVMSVGIISLEIIVGQFMFNQMMFQMLQDIGQYSGATTDDPH